ncbi:MAG: acyl-CoA thioesterase, partial [Gammaproteobacteria bacterium]|nr:acyl-CoA thioesterase [Gammaproteobacteria bacterium]
MSQPQHLRSDYRHFQPITTRWHDNDVYGHVNNVTYYSFFDSAVNTYLIEVGGLDIHNGDVVGFVVSSSCDYFASIAFPE